MTARELNQRILSLGNPNRGQGATRFFKTGPGESGEGLRFLGLSATELRGLAKEFRALPLDEIVLTLSSPWHDERAVALLVMTLQFPKSPPGDQRNLYNTYLANTTHINSWALVDCSAPHIVGAYLFARSRTPLVKLARSKSLWERRISMVATQHFIRKNDFADTLRIAEMLITDEEDLIHKASGWMLREVGQRDQAMLEAFLRRHYSQMPRTMLRYAIEKLPEKKRRAYLAGTI